ncbi:MAG: potassium channel family protein [Chitinophagaceae bacterium]|nr:potassium channel family protein [Chitinophagaceae bacterium]
MEKKTILVFGTGHLAYRLKATLTADNYQVVHATLDEINGSLPSVSLIENLQQFLKQLDVETIRMVYLLDEKDEVNLQLIIALISLYPNISMAASLFNENLIPHLQSQHSNVTIFNPAKIAAPHFAAALLQPVERKIEAGVIHNTPKMRLIKKDTLIQKLLLTFMGIIVVAVLFFHFYEKLSWIDSFYFVIVTVATVGYGDINLAASSSLSKIFGILLILSSTFFIWMIFSLTIDRILKKRIMLALGRKKYHCKDHIILCGLGRLGYFIAEELLQKGEKLIIIEQHEDGRYLDYFRQLGAEIYIGDGRITKVLDDTNVAQARALISVINNDSINLEIGLNSRSFQPGIRLILRIFDEQMAKKIKEYLHIDLTLSASEIANKKFYEILKLSQ